MVAALRSPPPFAEDESGFGYFRSDHHHRFLAAAIARQLAKGHSFVLVVGEPGADGELIERFFAEQSEGRRPASLVRCLPQMNFRDIVRAYNRNLGLSQEADSGGLWTLLAHLMLEARNGISRVLMLDGAEALDLRSFEELQRFSQLDGPHVMPVVLLTGRDGAERLEAPPLEFLSSAMAARVEVEWLDPEEVGAFIQYQINAASEADAALIPPASLSAIAAACGGSPAEVNRLVREVLAASGREREYGLSAPFPAAIEPREESATAEELRVEDATAEPQDGATPREELEESAAEVRPPAVVVPIVTRLPAAGRAAPRRRNRRLFRGLMVVVYLAIATLLGQGLLYLLAPPRALHEPPSTIVAAVPPLPPAVPAPSAAEAVAESPSASDDDIPQSGGEAPTSAAAAQAAALEPVAGPPPGAVAPARRGEIESAAPPPPPETAVPPPPETAVPPPPETAVPPLPAVAASPAEASPSQIAVAVRAAPAAIAPPQEQAVLAAPPKAADEPQPGPMAPPAVPAAVEAPPVGGAPAPSAAPPVDTASAAETAVMVRRASELLTAGDVVSARRFFERAARAGDPAAECGLAKSYDPLYLRQIGARGPAGDAAVAIDWYRRAAAAGSVEAIARLERLRATPP